MAYESAYTGQEIDTAVGRVLSGQAVGPQGPAGPQGETGPQGPAGANGGDGATFTPSVSEAGVISWTNDKGLPNPEPVNIKGPPGEGGGSTAGVASFNGRTGAVEPQAGDYTANQVSFVPGDTGMTSGNVQEAVQELFTSVSDGKSLIASAITDKGVPTASDAAFQTMKENILAIPSGGLPDNVYTIDVQASDPEGGTVAGGGVAASGMTVTVSATPAENHKFSGWGENSSVVSEDEDYTFTVSGDRSLVAGFAEKPPSRLPEGYTEVEYIQTNGKVSFTFSTSSSTLLPGMRAVLDLEASPYTSNNEFIFWTQSGNANQCRLFRASSTSFGYYFGGTRYNVNIAFPSERTTLDLDLANKKLTIGDTSRTLTVSNVSTSSYIYLFASDANDTPLPAKLFSAQLYNGSGTLLCNYIPCVRDSDGAVGLYDIVRNSFKSASQQSAIIAGPAI